jgi:Ca2+-binding EF-hand superfamily protein
MNDEDLTIAEEEVRKIILEVDNDGDGEIDYKEFIDMMSIKSNVVTGETKGEEEEESQSNGGDVERKTTIEKDDQFN